MKRFVVANWGIIFLFLTWSILAAPYLFGRLVPFPSDYLVAAFAPWSTQFALPVKNGAMPDVITQIYPWKKLVIDTWKSGQVPLWNPYSFGGTPLAGNYQSAAFSPFNLLFFILPMIDAWSLLILLQPLLAGIFIFWFMRALDRSQAGSVVSGIAFMFCGFMVVWMAYGTLGYAMLWLPFVLLFVRKQYSGFRWIWGSAISFGIAMSFLSGHFQMSLYVLLATVSYILYLWSETRKLKAVWASFLFVALGVILAAPQILLAAQAYSQSGRSTSIAASAIPWRYLITMFVPDYFGNPVTRNDWFGQYAEWSSYTGIVPILLAGYALFRRFWRQMLFFGLLGSTALALATPTLLNSLLPALNLPVISTSVPTRFIALVSFSWAVLAGFGLDSLWSDWKKEKVKVFIQFSVIVLVFFVLLWVLTLSGFGLPAGYVTVAKRNLILPSGLAGIFVLAAYLGWLRRKIFIPILISGILVVAAGDGLRYATKWLPAGSRQHVYPATGITDYLQSRIGSDRALGNYGAETAVYFGLPAVEGYDAVYQKRYGELLFSVNSGNIVSPARSVVVLDKHGQHTEKLLQLMSVRYYLHKLSDGRYAWAYPYWEYSHYQSRYQDGHYELLENISSYPLAFLVGSYVVRKEPQLIVDQLFADDFDRRAAVVLETRPVSEPTPGPGTADIVEHSANKIIVRTRADGPKLLFISQGYESGWKAKVDGRQTLIYRADYAFSSLPVSAGEHLVELVYWPEAFVLGLWLSGFSLVALVAGGFIVRKYANRFL